MSACCTSCRPLALLVVFAAAVQPSSSQECNAAAAKSDMLLQVQSKADHFKSYEVEKYWEDSNTTIFVVYCAFWVAVWLSVCLYVVFVQDKGAAKPAMTVSQSTKGALNTYEDEGDLSIGPEPSYPLERRVIELVEDSVKKNPSAVALVVPGGTRKEITYAELGNLVGDLSSSILSLGITHGAVVALVLDRSVAQVVAIFGVLQAGAAFQPIDPGAPKARQALMLTHSEAKAVVSIQGDAAADELATGAKVHSVKLTSDGRIASKPASGDGPVEFTRPSIDSMALLIYTSGTTGTPKGIVYDQRHLMHGVHFFGAHCNMSASSVALLKSPYFWAVMEWEFFPALTLGGRLVVASPEGHKSPEYMANTILAEEVDVLLITPQVFDLVLDVHEGGKDLLQSVRHITTVGEPLSCSLANRSKLLCPGAQLHNFYGASESSCTIYTVPQEGVDLSCFPVMVPAGRPQPHSSVYLLTEVKQPDGTTKLMRVNAGETGEICFGGVLAARYWKDPEKTAEKFTDTREFGKLYRTGDLGRWSHAQLEVIGRMDRQVKINGVRIEPEESEVALKEFTCSEGAALKEVAVVASEEPAELVAFVVLRDGVDAANVTPDALRAHCNGKLATYYIPKSFVFLDSVPRLANGKRDLKKLTQMATEHVAGEGEMVADSLGQMKKMSKAAMLATAVTNRCYAYWMAGVLFDHFFRCDQGGCTILNDLHNVKPWTHAIIRSIGNNQDLFGFLMVSAYQDSRSEVSDGKALVKIGKKEVLVLLVYLLMGFPIPQLCQAFKLSGSGSFTSLSSMTDGILLGPHRWYLLMYVTARVYMAACQRLRLPALAQGLIVVALAFVTPPESSVNLCTGKSGELFLEEWLFRIADSKMGYCPLFYGAMLTYVGLYIFSFHYLHTSLEYVKRSLPMGPCWAAAALGMSMVLGMYMALFHYPNQFLEYGIVTRNAGVEVIVAFLQPALFTFAMAHVSVNLAWWGSTTLGTYVIHYYFLDWSEWLFKVNLVPFFRDADPTGLGLVICAIAFVLFFTTFLGPLAQAILLLPTKLAAVPHRSDSTSDLASTKK